MTWGIAEWTGTITLDRSTPTPAAAPPSGGATLSFQKAVTTTGGATSRTLSFTSIASAAGQERLVALVAITSDWSNTTFSSVAIDGQSALLVGSYVRVFDGSSTNGPVVSFWRAPGTANTSVDVTFNIAAGAVFDARGALWTLNNVGLLLDITADTRTPTIVNTTLNLDVDTAANGVAAAVHLAYTSSLRTTTWAGLTEQYDGTADSLYGGDWFSSSDLNVTSGSTPLTVTAALPSEMAVAGSGRAIVGLAVSFNPGAVSYDAATVAWAAAVVAAGGTVSAPRLAAVNTFIVGLKADGLWTKLDRYWLFASEGSVPATLVDIRSLQLASAVNSPALGSTGYTFDNSAKYIDTNCAPLTAGGVFVQNSAHVSVWAVSTPNWAVIGHYGASGGSELAYYSGAWQLLGPNDNTPRTASASAGIGLAIMTRTASNVTAAYFNGSSVSTGTATSLALPTYNIWVGGIAVAGHYTAGTIASASIGSGLDATNNTNFYNRQRTLMTSCGVP